MKKILIVFVIGLLLTGCSQSPEEIKLAVVGTLAAIPSATLYPTYTPQLTYTPYPTYTPLPTYIPVVEITSQAIFEDTPTTTPTMAQVLTAIGTIEVNNWVFEITEIHSDPGVDSSRQIIVLLGYITNAGMESDTFVAYGELMLMDSKNRKYEDDMGSTFAAQDKYGTEYGANISPGAKKFIAVAFDVDSSETTFTIIPGSLVSSWSGDITFTIP
jgi:hypothetical protein